MKYIQGAVVVIVAAVCTGLLYGVSSSHAQNMPLSDEHKQRISTNCTSAKSSLNQLYRSDVLLRVNRGQLYEYTGTKLMARLNSRLALNRLDGGQLVALAARFDTGLVRFRTAFHSYGEQLSSTLRINCARDPEAFYYSVLDARDKRAAVHQAVMTLNTIVDDYYQEFNQFSTAYRTPAQSEEGGQHE